MLAIVDYGAGNIRSVELAFARLGVAAARTRDPEVILAADGVALPGVGAFDDALEALAASGAIPALLTAVGRGVPFLGICLGMQLLFDGSEESVKKLPGLRLIPGFVRKLPGAGQKVPHMGWNTLTAKRDDPLLAGLSPEPYLYFVHSYACFADGPADVLTTTTYGVEFHSAVRKQNIVGMQFHPEKSGVVGETLLKNFIKMTGR